MPTRSRKVSSRRGAACLPWLLVAAFAASAALAAPRPNFLLICIDDLKPTLGCYGDRKAKSPSIDRFAAASVRFQSAYCNQAVCAPSRNALMTGLRPTSLGIYDLPTHFRKAAPKAVTLAQYFKQNGWHTEALGKIYHVGHGNIDDADSWSVKHWTPRGGGYQLESNRPPAAAASTDQRGASTECADVPDDAYSDGLIAEEAIARLKAAKGRPGTPFFLAVGFHKPHLPFLAPKRYWDMHDRAGFEPHPLQSPPEGAPSFAPTTWGELRRYSDIPPTGSLTPERQRLLIHGYYACVSYTDAQIGRVLEQLDQLGLGDNTIVILWGDHGWHLGDHGMWCKHTNYEEAARIPLLLRAPGQSNPGVSRALVETVDLYPTLCDLANLPVPSGLDGASFARALKEPETATTKEAVFHVFPRRAPDLGNVLGRAVRTERYRMVEWKAPGAAPQTAICELYDYRTDPQETRNLAADQPEIVAQLRAILAKQPEAKPQIPSDPAPAGKKAKAKKKKAAK